MVLVLTVIGSPVSGGEAAVVQYKVQRICFQGSFKQSSEQLCVAQRCWEVQRSPSLRVSIKSRRPMFQQSRYTALTAQHGL